MKDTKDLSVEGIEKILKEKLEQRIEDNPGLFETIKKFHDKLSSMRIGRAKYNPDGKDLSKAKMMARVGYKKGTFLTKPEELSQIILNGGYTEVKAQKSRQLDGKNVQVIECRVFFIDPNA
jgi:hypothetical protein